MLRFALGAFAYGFLKAAAVGGGRQHRAVGLGDVADPLLEECIFRGGLMGLGGIGPGLSALSFGAYHLDGTGHPVFRFADATLGGLLYASAFEKHGLMGAVVTHLAHNAGVLLA